MQVGQARSLPSFFVDLRGLEVAERMYLGFYAEDLKHLARADWTPSKLQASASIRVLYVYFTGLIHLRCPQDAHKMSTLSVSCIFPLVLHCYILKRRLVSI
jgi:hypothetical protein